MATVGVLFNTFEGTHAAFAGGHIHAFEVLARLSEFEVVVFAPDYAEPAVRRHLPTASFVAMPSLPVDYSNVTWLYLHRTIMSFKALKRLRLCDVVYATSPFLPDIVPAMLAKPGRAVVCIFHLMPVPSARNGSLVRNAIAFCAEALGLSVCFFGARSVIVGTYYTARRLRRRGFRQKMFVTTNGVEHLALQVRGQRDRKAALFIGRLHPTKGLSDLLRAWAEVLCVVPDAHLSIVGAGEPAYRERLKAEAHALGVAHAVTFVGRASDGARSQLLASARVFIFPSYEEGWGIAVAEAMAFGLPCVTYALPVFAEVFPSGRRSATIGDVSGIALQTLALMQNDDLWTKTAAEALTIAKTFSWSRAADAERDALEFANVGVAAP